MDTYYMQNGSKIDENLEVIPASSYRSDESRRAEFFAGLVRMDASDLIAYAEAVPTWDYVEDGMWEYIAYSLGLDPADYPDPDAFLAAAKHVLSSAPAKPEKERKS